MPITDHTVRQGLQMCLVTRPDLLGKGKDVRPGQAPYSKLHLAQAWRIEHHVMWKKYQLAQVEVQLKQSFVKQTPLYNSAANRQDGLYNWQDATRAQLDPSVNEALAAHATKPGSVAAILDGGLNERLCSLDGMFGGGAYLAEDCGKCDQYAAVDAGPHQHPELHQLLYQAHGLKHPLNVHYAFLCRVTLGAVVRTVDGVTSLDGGRPIWAGRDRRELAMIPGSDPPAPYHALLAETGGVLKRYREVVVFHTDRVYPEYLVAYWRR